METYLKALESSETLKQDCERLLTVSISRFFRDRRLWRALQNEILPSVVQKNKKGTVRVWSAGCARGEEAYTVRMVWEETKTRFGPLPPLHLLATDVNPLYLEKARKGIYSPGSLREIPVNMQSRYFTLQPGGHLYAVKPFIRAGITWKVHDLFSGPPGKGFHIIFVRNNLLTYYGAERIGPALKSLVESLSGGGFLIIGSHEKIPGGTLGLRPLEGLPCVFLKGGP